MLAKERYRFIKNVLETTFCRAFQSLPGPILTTFFGPGEYANVGLNNLPPLFEGRDIPAFIRSKYSEYHRDYADLDNRDFVAIRKAQKASERNARCREASTLLKTDYLQAMEELAASLSLDSAAFTLFAGALVEGDTLSTHVEAELQELMAAVVTTRGTQLELFPPIGNAQAKIGIVLTAETIGIKWGGTQAEIKPLDGYGLTHSNSVVWTSSFQGIGSGGCQRFPEHQARIDQLNRSIITESTLRIVLLCGLQAQTDILSALQHSKQLSDLRLSGPHSISFRGYPHRLWLMAGPENEVVKVLIACPEPLVRCFNQDISKVRRMRDICGLIRALTGLRLKHSAWENACFFAALIAQFRRQKEGSADPLSAATLDPIFGDWLHYRGFMPEDIRDLESRSGNLILGILWITSWLSQRSRGCYSTKDAADRRYRGSYDRETYERTRELFDSVYSRRIASILARRSEEGSISSIEMDEREESEGIREDGVWLSQGHIDSTECDADEDGTMNKLVCRIERDPMVKLVSELKSDQYTQSKKRSKDNRASQQGPLHSGPPPSYSVSANFRARLTALTSKAGCRQHGSQRKGQTSWRLNTFYSLLSFVAKTYEEDRLPPRPFFALRADLSGPGARHPHCIYPGYTGCLDTDPCIRLGFQYCLLDEATGKKMWKNWRWAEVSDHGFKPGTSRVERISKANTLVDLLEGKTPHELVGVPRRSTIRWTYNR